MTDSDTARRARLEEIIREGRRVRSNVTQLHSSPQRNTFTSNLSYSSPYNSQTTIASPYSSSIHQPHFQPTHQTPQQSPQHHHQAPDPQQAVLHVLQQVRQVYQEGGVPTSTTGRRSRYDGDTFRAPVT